MKQIKLELKSKTLIQRSDPRSKNRSRLLRLNYEKGENNKVYYSVDSGTRPGKKHIVVLSAPSLKEDSTEDEVKKVIKKEDIRVSCTCEAFLYLGYKYITYRKKAGIDPETRPPVKRNPAQEGMLCKHIIAVLKYLGIS